MSAIDLLMAAQNAPAAVWLRGSRLTEPLLLAGNVAACVGLGLLLVSGARHGAPAPSAVGLTRTLGVVALTSAGGLMVAQPFQYADWRLGALELGLLAASAWRSLRGPPGPFRN